MMNDEKSILYEYELLMLGKTTRFTLLFSGSKEENLHDFAVIWRYAITNLLHWTPQEAELYLTDDIMKTLVLDRTIKAIGFEKSRTYITDYKYFLNIAFPNEIKYSFTDDALAAYDRVVNYNESFPHKFFSLDDIGYGRAKIIMYSLIRKYFSFMPLNDAYAFFSRKSVATKWIKEKRLDMPLNIFFSSPIHFFHEALPPEEKSDFYYYLNICKANLRKDIQKKKNGSKYKSFQANKVSEEPLLN